MSDIYLGACSCRALCVSIRILNCTRYLTGNQCRSFNIGVVWLWRDVRVTVCAAVFCVRCNLLIYLKLLQLICSVWSTLECHQLTKHWRIMEHTLLIETTCYNKYFLSFYLETQSCFWCCKETPTSICKPHPNNYTVPNGTACVMGYCDDQVKASYHKHDINKLNDFFIE